MKKLPLICNFRWYCWCTYCVKGLIEAGKAFAPARGVCWGVIGVPPEELGPQNDEDKDEQDEQQHEIFQGHHTLQK